jgi:GntR family transcriptional regulator
MCGAFCAGNQRMIEKQIVKDPVYHQLQQLLKNRLASGAYQAREQFLTERQIAAEFGVSRTTANKALASLIAEGWLEFRKGVGTFVRQEPLRHSLESLVSFTAKVQQMGHHPGTSVLRFDRVLASTIGRGAKQLLKVEPHDELWSIERLRFIDAVAVIWEERFVSYELSPHLTKADAAQSLYAYWMRQPGLVVHHVEQTITAIALDSQIAGLLKVEAGGPALSVEGVGQLENGRPLWWERTIYLGSAFEFRHQLSSSGNTTGGGLLRPIDEQRGGLGKPWVGPEKSVVQ